MKIKSNSKLITEEQMIKLIELLPKKYQTPKRKLRIQVFGNSIHQRAYELLKFIIWNSKYAGATFFHSDNRSWYFIHIYPYRLNNEFKKLKIVEALYHELRHVYQLDCMTNWYWKQNHIHENVSKRNCLTYSKQPLEMDADRFARVYMNRLHDEINQILDIEKSWQMYHKL